MIRNSDNPFNGLSSLLQSNCSDEILENYSSCNQTNSSWNWCYEFRNVYNICIINISCNSSTSICRYSSIDYYTILMNHIRSNNAMFSCCCYYDVCIFAKFWQINSARICNSHRRLITN